VKSSREHPIEWWMTGGRSSYTVRALARFQSAVIDGELSHDGSSALTRHVLAARMVHTRSGVQIAKEHPASERKVDGAIAATLALACGDDALAAGLGVTPVRRVPRRIR
jgi:phage terminase large subunit-like protein